jgi:5-aminolevulinate synthase
MSPVTCAGALAAVKYLKAHDSVRQLHQAVALRLKLALADAGIPAMAASTTHIVPVIIGNAKRCKAISDLLLADYNIYTQAIGYPTVPEGTERLRFAPTPFHDNSTIADLVVALTAVLNKSDVDLGI